MADTCGRTLRLAVDTLTCDEPAGHDQPTDDYPAGTPHADSDYLDQLTGEPWRWLS